MDEIRLDLSKQISKTNEALTNNWGRLYLNGLESNNIDFLENLLSKIKRDFRIYNIASTICAILLTVYSLLKYFNFVDFGNMNKAGLMILFTIVFLMNSFRFYKIKVNLENKIYLLRLLNKIDSKK